MAENFFGITDTGKVRDNNEDAFIAKKVLNDKFVIACAIDGVGGYSGGEIAAGIARESIFEKFANPSGDLIEAMKASFILANKKIFAEKQQTKEHSKMACVLTLAIVDLENNQFHYAHVGDTRLYLLRDNSLVKVSKDHSFVGFLEDSGRIDEDAAMKHIKRNEINKALGFGNEIETQSNYIETGTSPFLPGDMLLLCSDGLTDMVNKEAITSVLTDDTTLEQKATQLIALANKNGGKDNITVVLVHNDSASSWQSTLAAGVIHKPNQSKSATTPTTSENIQPNQDLTKKKAQTGHEVSLHVKKKGGGINKLLAGLCLLLLGSTLFLLWRNSKPIYSNTKTEVVPADTVRNAQELKLQELINSTLTGDTLLLSDSLFKQPIVLTDTINIHQDSLFILSKGKIVFKGDSSFTGPAIQLSADTRFVLLDGLQFENFDIALSAQNDALYFQNIQFLNCKRPVCNYFIFPEKQFISGRLAGAYTFKTDSLKTPER